MVEKQKEKKQVFIRLEQNILMSEDENYYIIIINNLNDVVKR